MALAAKALVGRHDFSSFQAAGTQVESTVRTLTRLDITGHGGAEIGFEVAGDGFLRHMVRNLVGILLEVGRGRREPAAMAEILAARDRSRAGPTAPARGLTLVEVNY
jgi:tRNA pseudouridine38-40 synthase